jgi:hypothetical protein
MSRHRSVITAQPHPETPVAHPFCPSDIGALQVVPPERDIHCNFSKRAAGRFFVESLAPESVGLLQQHQDDRILLRAIDLGPPVAPVQTAALSRDGTVAMTQRAHEPEGWRWAHTADWPAIEKSVMAASDEIGQWHRKSGSDRLHLAEKNRLRIRQHWCEKEVQHRAGRATYEKKSISAAMWLCDHM